MSSTSFTCGKNPYITRKIDKSTSKKKQTLGIPKKMLVSTTNFPLDSTSTSALTLSESFQKAYNEVFFLAIVKPTTLSSVIKK
jgi:hypothetical protein